MYHIVVLTEIYCRFTIIGYITYSFLSLKFVYIFFGGPCIMTTLSGIHSHQQVNQFISDSAGRCPFVLRQLPSESAFVPPPSVPPSYFYACVEAGYCGTVLHCTVATPRCVQWSQHTLQGRQPSNSLYLLNAVARKCANTPATYIACCR